MGQKLGSSLAEGFWLGVSYKLTVKILAGLGVICSNAMVAHSHGWQIHAGDGKPQFFPMSASSRVAWVSSYTIADFSQNKQSGTTRQKSGFTYDLASEFTHCHFLLILLVTILTPTNVFDTSLIPSGVHVDPISQRAWSLTRLPSLEMSVACWRIPRPPELLIDWLKIKVSHNPVRTIFWFCWFSLFFLFYLTPL